MFFFTVIMSLTEFCSIGAEFREAHNYCEKYLFFTVLSENGRHFWGVELLGALLAPRWPQMRSGPPVELHLEAS